MDAQGGPGGSRLQLPVRQDRVAALVRRRDLPALLDPHVPLGPDRAAVRLGVRRSGFDQAVRLGWPAPVSPVDADRAAGRSHYGPAA